MTRIKVLSGIDLPLERTCGSMLLCEQLYEKAAAQLDVRFLSLPPKPEDRTAAFRYSRVLTVEKAHAGAAFDEYVSELTDQVERQVRDFKPQLIHVQHLSFGMSLALLAAAPRVPKIAFCHGTAILSALDDPDHIRRIRSVVRACDVIVFPTRQMAADAADVVGSTIDNGLVLSWGVTDEVFCDKLITRAVVPPIKLLFAGRLVPDKGVDLLLEMMALLRENATLTVVGAGPELGSLRTRSEELGLGSSVTFRDWATQREVFALMDSHDAVMVPSRRIEAFGLIAAEAMARGKPVIHSRTGGLEEVVGFPELCVAAGDSIALAEAVRRLGTDVGLGERWAAHAALRAEDFRMEQFCHRVVALSERVASRGGIVSSD